MKSLNHATLRTISRRFWGAVFTLIIATAVCVQLGRQAFPLIKDYQGYIADYFGRKLSMVIEVGEIDASWSGLRPKLQLKDVRLLSLEGQQVFKVSGVALELSLLNSASEFRLAWRQLGFEGLEATLEQRENGTWFIPGMPDFLASKNDTDEKDKFTIDDPYDVFLFGRRVNFSDATFTFKYFSGEQTQVVIPSISLENDRDFHRILASIDVDGEQAFSLIVEGHGDPRDNDFLANGYIQLSRFPTRNVTEALAIPFVEGGEHHLDLRLWFRADPDKGLSFRGKVLASGDIEIKDQDLNLPQQLSTTVFGKLRDETGWQLLLQDLRASWENFDSPPLDASLYGNFRALSGLRVQALDVQKWVQVVEHVGVGNPDAEKAIKALNPSGFLKNLHVAFTSKEEGYFQATAKLEQGRSGAYMGAPSFDNLNGYVSASLRGGQFSVATNDGLTIGLPKVYHDPLFFEQAEGQLGWQIDFEKRTAYITSSLLTLTNPEEQGKGYLYLSLPFSKKWGEQHMTLAIGVANTLAKNHKKYVPKTIPKHLYSWLDTSIKEGRITNARFLYHGSVEKDPPRSPTIQLYGEVHDGNLVFDPNWPELEQVSGSLSLENNDLDVRIDKASLLGNSVYDAAIHLVKNPSAAGQALSVKGSLASDAESAMTLIKSSPIKQLIGSTFDQWQVSGGVGAHVELLIPLSSEAAGAGLSHNIDVKFSEADVLMQDLDIHIADIAGELHYQTEKGIYTNNLSGNIWGRPFLSTIESPQGDDEDISTIINFSGVVDIADMYQWTQRPELKFAEGTSPITGQLLIPTESSGRPLEVGVSTPLDGVAIQLPKPFNKSGDEKVEFHTQIRFFEHGEEYRFKWQNKLYLALLNAANDDVSAHIELHPSNTFELPSASIASTGRFDVSGSLPYFDLEEWNAAKDAYFSYVEANANGEVTEEDDTPVSIDVFIDKFLLGTFEIEKLKVDGQRREQFWALDIESELMTGQVLVPEDDSPIALDLDYLRFAEVEDAPAEGEGAVTPEKQSVLADIDLSRAVALDFSAEEFMLGAVNYGKWDFKLRPIENGILVKDIHAKVKSMEVGANDSGAQFIWLKDENGQNSQFSGVIRAGNLADVFEAWEQEKLMESESAIIDINAQWPGAPDEVTLKTVKGLIALDVNKGSFSRGAGSDENALLRLLALFNIDTILRRLRLDFSDLAAQGFSYDRVHGNLDFRDGTIYLTEPLIVESSSSYVQFAGTIDVVNEKLDSEMVITLPVASNIALATALVVNLPAALGIYVMSKLFKKQVDRASSASVEVNGDWSDPKLKVKRIFDIDAASRRGQEVRDENAGTGAVP